MKYCPICNEALSGKPGDYCSEGCSSSDLKNDQGTRNKLPIAINEDELNEMAKNSEKRNGFKV